jgi:hypothetical protein
MRKWFQNGKRGDTAWKDQRLASMISSTASAESTLVESQPTNAAPIKADKVTE